MSDFHNPWRESLENCIEGSNYLRASEYRQLIEELDDLYCRRAQDAEPQPSPEPSKKREEIPGVDYGARAYAFVNLADQPAAPQSADPQPDKDEIMRLHDEAVIDNLLERPKARAALDAAIEKLVWERDEALRGLRVQSVEYAEAVDDLRQAEERAERAEQEVARADYATRRAVERAERAERENAELRALLDEACAADDVYDAFKDDLRERIDAALKEGK